MAELCKAWPTVRDEGWRAFLAKLLDATVYSRLTLFTLEVPASPPAPTLPPGVATGWLPAERLPALADERPGSAARTLERAARGDRCFAVELDGVPRNLRWIARGRARIEHLDCDLPLGTDDAYHYDLWTDPAARRRGLAALGTAALLVELAGEGVRRVTRAIIPENAAGAASARAAGFRETGTIWRLGIGRLSRLGVRRASGET
jgi:GNAT superfamily N-acetyltransferase